MKKTHVKDFYFYKAKREKYSARSVYKLKNIQEKYKLISRGNRVLDLGASPGSWTEYLVELIGKTGLLVALDERDLSITAKAKIKKRGCDFLFFQQSIFEPLPKKLAALQFDCVVSDLAPLTSGPKLVDSARSLELVNRAFDIAQAQLKVGGHFVVKLFQSPDSVETAKSWEKAFKLAKLYKPPSTHKESKEIYFVGRHLLP